MDTVERPQVEDQPRAGWLLVRRPEVGEATHQDRGTRTTTR